MCHRACSIPLSLLSCIRPHQIARLFHTPLRHPGTAALRTWRSSSAFTPLLTTLSFHTSRSSSSMSAPSREATGNPTEEEEESYRKSRIYTRTGDTGMTSLYNLERRCKAEDFFQALGTVDEVNSQLGVVREYALQEDNGLEESIALLQSRLLDIGAHLATPLTSSSPAQVARMQFDEEEVRTLEHWIDKYDAQLPKLTSFVLPSGGLCASHLHVSRTIARRAEREVVPLVQRGDVANVVLVWLNRLSDLLFVMARYASMKAGKEETTWKKARVKKTQATDDTKSAPP